MEIVEAAKMLKGYSDEDDMPTLMRLMLKRHTANFRESEDYKRLYWYFVFIYSELAY